MLIKRGPVLEKVWPYSYNFKNEHSAGRWILLGPENFLELLKSHPSLVCHISGLNTIARLLASLQSNPFTALAATEPLRQSSSILSSSSCVLLSFPPTTEKSENFIFFISSLRNSSTVRQRCFQGDSEKQELTQRYWRSTWDDCFRESGSSSSVFGGK